MDSQASQLKVGTDTESPLPLAPESLKLQEWDPAVFASDILLSQSKHKDFAQTSKSISVAYGKIMMTIQSLFDVADFEPSLAPHRALEDKKKVYKFSTNNNYPPHLELVPEDQAVSTKELFESDKYGKLEFSAVKGAVIRNKLGRVADLFQAVIPNPKEVETFKAARSFAELAANYKAFRETPGSLSKPSVGDLSDGKNAWYTDAIFAEQNFNGTNPTTIELAKEWKQKFLFAAEAQNLDKHALLLSTAEDSSLYVQDCSYFREAFGVSDPTQILSVGGDGIIFKSPKKWACASVTLFQLDGQGRLHPLAIVIDYQGSMEKSVVIFNQRLTADDDGPDQSTDWAWRYAKTCSQVSDWIRHELAIHLTQTHLLEEPIIVASQRTLPSTHIIYKILSPHWDKTLSLNAAARETLVPQVIVPIIGVKPDQVKNFINYSYSNFDFEGKYIPADLEARGFPLKELGDLLCHCDKQCDTKRDLSSPCTAGCGPECHQPCDPRFVNYTYARNMKLMWNTLRKFVKGYLATAGYTEDPAGDKKVQNDTIISDWVHEIQSSTGAAIKKFPNIKTAKSLIDAITMCLHIASPQHTAVNYLQQYYLSFVVNKPPALCTAPPKSLGALKGYGESDVIAALPVAQNRDADWLLASHLPALLSQTVTKDLNLVAYAVNVYSAARLVNDKALQGVAENLCRDLWLLGNTFAEGDQNQSQKTGVFTVYSDQLAPGLPKYTVMDPVVTAISILI